MFLLNIFIWIILLIVFYNLVRVGVREAIYETKEEIIKDLKDAIKEAIIQAEKDKYEVDNHKVHNLDEEI
ncbi:hypothetical protein [Anaerosolibacter sp.]|uniref:hypothetical protein n=1 Tax=Anaerosolibacter sp. TaxID=1872527 RepID=UPI0039EEC0C2